MLKPLTRSHDILKIKNHSGNKKSSNTKTYSNKETQRAKTVLRANNDNGAFGLPEFKTGKNATTVKTVSYLQKNRQRDQ